MLSVGCAMTVAANKNVANKIVANLARVAIFMAVSLWAGGLPTILQ
jgi:hypothetical protein